MVTRRWSALALFSALLSIHAASADEGDEARTLVAKAIEAAGGTEALARYQTPFHLEYKGKSFSPMPNGPNSDVTIKETRWFPDRLRTESQVISMGKTISSYIVFNGEKVLSSSGFPRGPAVVKQPAPKVIPMPNAPVRGAAVVVGSADPGSSDQERQARLVEGIRRRLHVDQVRTLLPLLDEGFQLSTVPETVIDKRPSVGVDASYKDQATVRLYFDKETMALVKLVHEPFVETYDDYAEIDGIVYPEKISQYLNGRKFRELETIELKFLNDVPEGTFEGI